MVRVTHHKSPALRRSQNCARSATNLNMSSTGILLASSVSLIQRLVRVSESRDSALLVPNADSFLDFGQEDLSVADFSCGSALQDGVHGGIHQVFGDHQLNLHFRQKVNSIFAAAVNFGVALLPAVPPN